MKKAFAVMTVIVMLSAVSALADRYVVALGDAEITTVGEATPGMGDYFVLQLQPPAGVSAKSLRYAILEVYVDASARSIDGYVERTPLFEVFALEGAMSGELNSALFRTQTTPSVRNVAVGDARRVVIDITEIIRGHLKTPESNNGIVMGSLVGSRAGVFALRDDKLGASVKAQVSFFD